MPREKMDFKSLYSTETGKMLHTLVQNTLYNLNATVLQNIPLYVPEYNIKGEADVAIIDPHRNNVIHLIDIKTMRNYPWSKRFGKKDNRDAHADDGYELQVGTYHLGLQRLFPEKEIKDYLLYLRKESGSLRIRQLNIDYNLVHEYWIELGKYIEKRKEGKIRPIIGTFPTPYMEWECRVCPYKGICLATKN